MTGCGEAERGSRSDGEAQAGWTLCAREALPELQPGARCCAGFPS